MVYWYFIATPTPSECSESQLNLYFPLFLGFWIKLVSFWCWGGAVNVILIGVSYLWGWEEKLWGVKSITREANSDSVHHHSPG